MMRKFRWLLLPLILCGTGCDRSDGDRLGRIGRKVTEKVEALIPSRTPFSGPLAMPGIDRVEVRVKERIKTDKYLAPFPIEVIAEGNRVRLQGSISDEVLKKRTIDLAESTTGVEQVIDALKVEKE